MTLVLLFTLSLFGLGDGAIEFNNDALFGVIKVLCDKSHTAICYRYHDTGNMVKYGTIESGKIPILR